MHSLVRGAYAHGVLAEWGTFQTQVSMHSLVRGAYAPITATATATAEIVSMHSLVRGAYALHGDRHGRHVVVSMHSLVRGAYALGSSATSTMTCFYALSRARCLCTGRRGRIDG